MSMYPDSGEIPDLTFGWRLRMAVETSGKSVQQVAEDLGVNRDTIRRWGHDVTRPKLGMIKQIALATGVPWTWLDSGEVSEDLADAPERSDNPDVTVREAA